MPRKHAPRTPPPKPPKRPRGAGSVYRRKDGRWVASLTLGYEVDARTGRRRRISQDSYHHSDTEAYRWLDKASAELEEGRYTAPGDKTTVGQYVTSWLEDVVRPTKEPMTHQTYLAIARKHILPQIGSVPLQKLTPAQVQAMLTRIALEGGSVPLRRYVKVVLGAALKQAVSWNLVERNVASLAILPSYRVREMRVFTKEEADKFLRVTETHPMHAAFVIAVTVGLRVGEYLSLRWSDIDLARGTLRVRTTVQHVTGRGLLVKQTKTKSSERTVYLPAVVLKALTARRDIQADERAAALARVSSWSESGYIFTDRQGRIFKPATFRRVFYRMVAEAGVPRIRLHDLRHTAATHMIAAGIALPTVSRILGHRSTTVTMSVYAHVIESMEASAVHKLNELWS